MDNKQGVARILPAYHALEVVLDLELSAKLSYDSLEKVTCLKVKLGPVHGLRDGGPDSAFTGGPLQAGCQMYRVCGWLCE